MVTAHLSNVHVVSHEGLTSSAAVSAGADLIVRSFAKEYRNEMAMAAMNRAAGAVSTVFLDAPPGTATISSTFIRTLVGARRYEALRGLVPPAVYSALTR